MNRQAPAGFSWHECAPFQVCVREEWSLALVEYLAAHPDFLAQQPAETLQRPSAVDSGAADIRVTGPVTFASAVLWGVKS